MSYVHALNYFVLIRLNIISIVHPCLKTFQKVVSNYLTDVKPLMVYSGSEGFISALCIWFDNIVIIPRPLCDNYIWYSFDAYILGTLSWSKEI